MKINSLFKIHSYTLAKLILLSLVMGVSSILSPFTIRSVVDGFLISQDRSALFFALTIIATIEAISFASDFLFRSILSDQSAEKMVLVKTTLLENFKAKRVFQLKDTFLRTWEIDIKRTVNYEMKQKWLRYKDLFMLLLLSFVMINLSSQAGLFILAVSAIQFGLAAWDVARNKEDIGSLRQTEETEHIQLKYFFQNLQKSYDIGFIKEDIISLNKSVLLAADAAERTEDRRSFLINIKTISRGVLILGALTIAAFGGVDMSWAAGTFWALLMIVFRLTNPIYSLAQWFYSEKSILASKQRVDDLFSSLSVDVEGTIYYQQFKNSIGKLILNNSTTNKNIQIIIHKDEQSHILNAIRIWSAKFLWEKSKILDNTDYALVANDLKKYFIFNFSSLQSKAHNLELNGIRSTDYTLVTSVPLPPKNFNESYIWNTETEKFIRFNSEKEHLPLIKNTLISDSTTWSEAFRDIKIYSKLGISFEIIHFISDQKIDSALINKNLRDVDHCLPLPNNAFIFILVGSTGQGFASLHHRFSDHKINLSLKQRLLISPTRTNWTAALDQAELSILNMVLLNESTAIEGAA